MEFREKSCSLPYLKNFSKLEGPYKSGRHLFWDLQQLGSPSNFKGNVVRDSRRFQIQ
jgi:hypothetical protein